LRGSPSRDHRTSEGRWCEDRLGLRAGAGLICPLPWSPPRAFRSMRWWFRRTSSSEARRHQASKRSERACSISRPTAQTSIRSKWPFQIQGAVARCRGALDARSLASNRQRYQPIHARRMPKLSRRRTIRCNVIGKCSSIQAPGRAIRTSLTAI
jgi:hypothetical protein